MTAKEIKIRMHDQSGCVLRFIDYQLLFVSGKGGVGKSLVSASLAQLAASRGKKVLLVECSAIEQLPVLFGYPQPVGHNEIKVENGISCINLNVRECFREYVVDHLGMEQLYRKVLDRKLMKSFLYAMPGLSEIMLLGRLYHTCQVVEKDSRYDLVIFDAPASGHFYNLLNTPQAVIDARLAGPLVREIKKVTSFLQKKELCASLLITLPEELVSSETLEFIPRFIQESPVGLEGIFLNKYIDEAALVTLENHYSCSSMEDKIPQVVEFLKRKIDRTLREQLKFFDKLKNFEKKSQCVRIPDLGVVQEPLDPKHLASFWRGVNFG